VCLKHPQCGAFSGDFRRRKTKHGHASHRIDPERDLSFGFAGQCARMARGSIAGSVPNVDLRSHQSRSTRLFFVKCEVKKTKPEDLHE
jgi:hypothetical protein